MALALNVTRRPFSFLGQQPADVDDGHSDQWGGFPRLKRKGIWHERLMDYAGSPTGRDQFEAQMTKLGEAAGISFDFNAYIDRQPFESQRLLLWAGRFGKGEQFISALSDRHFQQGSQGESASKRSTLLAAAVMILLLDGNQQLMDQMSMNFVYIAVGIGAGVMVLGGVIGWLLLRKS